MANSIRELKAQQRKEAFTLKAANLDVSKNIMQCMLRLSVHARIYYYVLAEFSPMQLSCTLCRPE